jgi:hypothetical protein
MEAYIKQINNWLVTGFTQHPTQFSEMFYFDKGESQFFSILSTDYFLFDENLEIPNDVSSSYPSDCVEFLQDKVKRLEAGDPLILAIPRLGNALEEMDILSRVDTFLNVNAINLEKSSLWLPEDGTIKIHIQDDITPVSPPSPNKVRSLFERIRSFFSRRHR